MKKISLTKGMVTIVDDDDYERLMKRSWQYGGGGYAVHTIRTPKTGMVYMHREIMNTPDGFQTDHINGNKLDNRKSNLRLVTFQQNGWNAKRASHNTSGYKGVSKRGNRWSASIHLNNKKIHLGYFGKKEDAANAYNKAAKKFFGEYAKLNNLIFFEYEYLSTIEMVREKIKECENSHMQQVAYSTFHDALTQICYVCKKIRTNIYLKEDYEI